MRNLKRVQAGIGDVGNGVLYPTLFHQDCHRIYASQAMTMQQRATRTTNTNTQATHKHTQASYKHHTSNTQATHKQHSNNTATFKHTQATLAATDVPVGLPRQSELHNANRKCMPFTPHPPATNPPHNSPSPCHLNNPLHPPPARLGRNHSKALAAPGR